MKLPVIDAHIHMDMYSTKEQNNIIQLMEKDKIEALITVSNHLSSAIDNLNLSREHKSIKAAFGFHPEQPIRTEQEMGDLSTFTKKHQNEMIAIGEVGLPYYTRKKDPAIPIEPYLEILETFIRMANRYNKPIVLHAVYEDAPIVCELLEKHSIQKAHFHWFKGDRKTIERMIENNYYISITPDIVYEEEILQLVKTYPISQLMVETDGPWPFEGPFQNKLTNPGMIHTTIQKIAEMKMMNVKDVYETVLKNTREFYGMDEVCG